MAAADTSLAVMSRWAQMFMVVLMSPGRNDLEQEIHLENIVIDI